MKTNFAIGCFVQWYEVDIIGEYVDSLKEAINAYDGEVAVDFVIVMDQELEKTSLNFEDWINLREKIKRIIDSMGVYHLEIVSSLYTIADYRRDFNNNYCESVDVLMWGESDALIPKQTFNILDNLHQMSLQNNNPKYLAFFGTCKMWDQSWEILEHPDFTVKPFIEMIMIIGGH